MRNIYCIWDRVAGSIVGALVLGVNDRAVERMFADVLADESTPISKHPGDYQLMKLGSINDSTGAIEAEGPEIVAYGSSYVKEK